jgi:hypothetical protein
MKLIIAGSRDIDPFRAFYEVAKAIWAFDINFTELVTGCATGPDQVPYLIREVSPATSIKEFPADWKAYGKSAGPKRNVEMAEYADALLLIWDGQSRGSKNMKLCMEAKGKPVYEIVVEE